MENIYLVEELRFVNEILTNGKNATFIDEGYENHIIVTTSYDYACYLAQRFCCKKYPCCVLEVDIAGITSLIEKIKDEYYDENDFVIQQRLIKPSYIKLIHTFSERVKRIAA